MQSCQDPRTRGVFYVILTKGGCFVLLRPEKHDCIVKYISHHIAAPNESPPPNSEAVCGFSPYLGEGISKLDGGGRSDKAQSKRCAAEKENTRKSCHYYFQPNVGLKSYQNHRQRYVLYHCKM